MDKKYRVVFLDLKESREDFNFKMSGLGVSADRVEEMVRKAPVVLKGDMSLGQARRYAEAVQQAGGRVHIQECGVFHNPVRPNRSTGIEPFENFTMCPECGFKQIKTTACVKCGFLLDLS